MTIRFSVMPTALTQPITTGAVAVDGVDLAILHPKTTDENSRAMIELQFDVAEMSIAAFTKAFDLGLPLLALPIFTSGRRFVQSGIYLSRSAELSGPEQLAGRAIGLPQYWISSCVWQRHVLEQVHGVRPNQVHWVTVERERFADLATPEDVDCRMVDAGDLAELMRSGEIDACMLQGGRPLPAELAELVAPAYPDLLQAERDYYTAAGVLPLMHITVMRRELAQSEPALVKALLSAYTSAKSIAEADPDTSWPLPALGHDVTALRELVDGDPWPFGVAANRAALDTFLTAAHEQGLVAHRPKVDELFVDSLPAEFA